MIKKIKALLEQYKEIVLYLFFGGLTTLVNIVSYFVCTDIFNIYYLAATAISWALSVAFAYVTNRTWVFASKKHGLEAILREIVMFVSCRLLSGAMDMAIMFIGVSIIGIPDSITKFLTQILVVVLNYIFSKVFIFRK